jgi:GTPase
MIDWQDVVNRPKKALLVGVEENGTPERIALSLLGELEGLAKTLGLQTVERRLVKLRERTPRYLVGSGKAEELSILAKSLEVDCIVFDCVISPSQQRNWEKYTELIVFDRSELIIQIFASRARTPEARMQVELARLQYSLPRLTHAHEDLERQQGGARGNRGAGEQQLELDRRQIKIRIERLKDDLEKVKGERESRRKRRDKVQVPSAAIVGYTNAGKSSLLNALTKADVFVEDALFATLDPTTRRVNLGGGKPVLLTDTVGFVRNLPHGLIEAFKSTLEETVLADLLIHVLDASDPDVSEHYAATMKVLVELGAADQPSILAFNKIDSAESADTLRFLGERHPGAFFISVKTGEGLPALVSEIVARLYAEAAGVYRIPADRYDLVARLRREAMVESEGWDEGSSLVTARIPDRLKSTYEEFKEG